MILLVPIAVGVAVALVRGGSLRRLADLHFRLGWLAALCFALQLWVVYRPAGSMESDRVAQTVLLMGTYAALVIVVWVNRRIAGMRVIALGLALNLAVMAANGGFMPVSPEAVVAARLHPAESLPPEGGRLPRSKDILLPVEQTRLWLLSDVIVAPGAPGVKIYSAGDLVVAIGAFLLLQAAMVPRRDEGVLGRNDARPS